MKCKIDWSALAEFYLTPNWGEWNCKWYDVDCDMQMNEWKVCGMKEDEGKETNERW